MQKSFFQTISRSEQGQGLMEYVIISALVGIVCLVAVQQLGDVLNTRIKNIKTELVKVIKI